jgi:atypical dual specificity phosphatase
MPFIHPDRHDTPDAALDHFADELPLLWNEGIRAVASMLNNPGAAATYAAVGVTFYLMPVPDGGAPTMEQFRGFLEFVDRQRNLKHPVAVHCEAGIGRTGTALAGYLIAREGVSVEDAFTKVRGLRRGAVETGLQMRFLREVFAAQQKPSL